MFSHNLPTIMLDSQIIHTENTVNTWVCRQSVSFYLLNQESPVPAHKLWNTVLPVKILHPFIRR